MLDLLNAPERLALMVGLLTAWAKRSVEIMGQIKRLLGASSEFYQVPGVNCCRVDKIPGIVPSGEYCGTLPFDKVPVSAWSDLLARSR